jgi:subtilisin family serine protease
VKRFVATALLVATVSVSSGVSVSASSTERIAEPVASKAVTSSPQLSGPGNTVPWGLDRIDQRTPVSSSRSYSFATNGTGVNIYVLDSGVAATHPEFGARVLNGWSYRSSSNSLASYSAALAANQQDPQTGIEACPNDGTHAVDPTTYDNPAQPDPADVGRFDNDGHGTHVAGIAAGDSVGVAKNANIIPVRALDSCGNGTRTMILEALAWILADHDAGEKAVLNLSVGFGEQVPSVDSAITAIMNEGVPVVAAAGNSGTSACSSTPASTFGVTTAIVLTSFLRVEHRFQTAHELPRLTRISVASLIRTQI